MKITRNVPLAECTSFGTGGVSEVFVVAETAEDVVEAIQTQPRPFWVLGRGANTLISDKGLPGTTIQPVLDGLSIDEDGLAIAETGMVWDKFVAETIASDLWGVELTSGIPGSVGAAIVGNIAAYGQAVSDTLIWIEVIDYSEEKPKEVRIDASELDLGYRSSRFNKSDNNTIIILRAAFQLSKAQTTELKYESALVIARELNLDESNLVERREIIMTTRERAGSLLDPQHTQKTAGSFFKNPMVDKDIADKILSYEEKPKTKEAILKQNKIHGGDALRMSAALVLLAAGFKRGQTWGSVRLHPDHILKIENTGDATSQDIYDVAKEIQAKVYETLDIELEAEIRFLGDFG